jgi:hypothetical protein
MGMVCRLSTMPATDCSAARTFSWGALRTIMRVVLSGLLYLFTSRIVIVVEGRSLLWIPLFSLF